MELTLESALSPGGLVGHFAYFLLVLSMTMRSIVWLRTLVVASALVGILYIAVWVHDPVSLFWKILLISVNIGALISIWFANRRARFTEEEAGFRASLLQALDPHEARRLFDQGEWINLPNNTPLTQEGRHPDFLHYIASGNVVIMSGERTVGTCKRGHFVGEMSLLDKVPASANARADGRIRVWRIPRPILDEIAEKKPKIFAAIEGAIARDMRAKIVRANCADQEPVLTAVSA